MKIAIRVDGGSQIGMGHVMRCLALANELQKSNNVFFVCRIDNPLSDRYYPGIEKIKNSNFELRYIKEESLKSDISKINADCIITDSYDVDEEYFDLLKENFKFSGYFDDDYLCDYYNVDFIINQNIYGESSKYNLNKNTKEMIGSNYVILRDEFRNHKVLKNVNIDIKNIMITLGGSDEENNTEKIIKQFLNTNFILHVVIGSGFNNVEVLKKYEGSNVKLYVNAQMKKIMNMCDICISACGSTIYELMSLGVPFIGVKVADNQRYLYKYIKEYSLGEVSDIENVNKKVEKLTYKKRVLLSKSLPEIIDGDGIKRIANIINDLR